MPECRGQIDNRAIPPLDKVKEPRHGRHGVLIAQHDGGTRAERRENLFHRNIEADRGRPAEPGQER